MKRQKMVTRHDTTRDAFLTVEGGIASKQDVRDDTNAPHVDGSAVGARLEDLRCDICRGITSMHGELLLTPAAAVLQMLNIGLLENIDIGHDMETRG